MHHSVFWVPVAIPAGLTIPIIVLNDGCILYEAWAFQTCPANRHKSSSWHEKAAQYLGLLYDYYLATVGSGQGDQADRFVDDFISALDRGTIQTDGSDHTNLRWTPRSRPVVDHACSVVRQFCEFTDDLFHNDQTGTDYRLSHSLGAAKSREHKVQHSKLFHLSKGSDSRLRYRSHKPFRPSSSSRVPIFPAELLPTILHDGCRRERLAKEFQHPVARQFNITLLMSLVLLAGGGIRKSELFHIFADDVRADSVLLYHPEIGSTGWISDGELKMGTRKEYLSSIYNLGPRSRLPKNDAKFAGWKNLLLDKGTPDNFARVYWLSPKLKSLFYDLHRIYINHVRPVGLKHPYYFVCLDHAHFGSPWTISAFNDAFERALHRIDETQSRARGTVPHGLRHLYGQTLVNLGVRPALIQHAMHHHSIESQMVYTRPSVSQITEALNAASGFDPSGLANEMNVNWENYSWRSDPLNLLAPWNLGRL